MAGIYIHIPFCRQACYYCNFYFSTSLQLMDQVCGAIEIEIESRRDFIEEKVDSVYFGGGTPSLLPVHQLERLILLIRHHFQLSDEPEITLEANPDDIDTEKLYQWHNLGINRLSVGLQSFDDVLLLKLNRVHTREEALKALDQIEASSFSNVNYDLIFAIPGQSLAMLEEDLSIMLSYRPSHLSLYNLTIEPKTVFDNWKRNGKLADFPDDLAAQQYSSIIEVLKENGYDHYEISNFALPGAYSRHNSNYWRQVTYLGLGPAAHSFKKNQRSFNIEHNYRYIKGMRDGQPERSVEILTPTDQLNEYLLTGLRTNWGCSLSYIKETFAIDLMQKENTIIQKHLQAGHIKIQQDHLYLSQAGKMLADGIIADLFQLPTKN